jgi:hypothetical protein
MIMDSVNLSVIKITLVTDSLNSKVYLTGQAISKLQIPTRGASACAARDQNISINYWMSRRHSICFEF